MQEIRKRLVVAGGGPAGICGSSSGGLGIALGGSPANS